MSSNTIKGKAPYLSPLIGFKNENWWLHFCYEQNLLQ